VSVIFLVETIFLPLNSEASDAGERTLSLAYANPKSAISAI
jgi:hypothetical protein